MITFAGHQHPQ